MEKTDPRSFKEKHCVLLLLQLDATAMIFWLETALIFPLYFLDLGLWLAREQRCH